MLELRPGPFGYVPMQADSQVSIVLSHQIGLSPPGALYTKHFRLERVQYLY